VTRAGFPQALAAEWIKLRSVRTTAWALAAGFGLTLLFTWLVCGGTTTTGGSPGRPGDNDIVKDSLAGVWIGQLPFALLAVLALASEYSSGTIRATFAANPRRRTILLAKTAVLGALVALVALPTAAASFVLGQSVLRGNGFNYEGGYPAVTLADGEALRAVAGTAYYLTALALLALGLTAVVRRTAVAITVVLGLLLLPPIAAGLLPERASDLVLSLSPAGAGLALQQTVVRDDNVPIEPATALLVLAAYALASLAAAAWLLRRRDV
jgi:ABC-2 type transport system permease protein